MEFLFFIINIAGLLASNVKYPAANPYQIYFSVWTFVSAGYILSADSWLHISNEFFIIVSIPNVLAIGLLYSEKQLKYRHNKILSSIELNQSNKIILNIYQTLVIIAMPFTYARANILSEGQDIFSIAGYIQLRASQTDGGLTYGIWGYFFILSFVTTAITSVMYSKKQLSAYRAATSVLVSICYVYMATGRTFALLLITMTAFPLIVCKAISYRGIALGLFSLIAIFMLIAVMTAKGTSIENGLIENVYSLLENIRSYTIAPIVGLSLIISQDPIPTLGDNSLRTIFSIFNAIGLLDINIKPLTREFLNVPDPTNVFTVYEAYFNDFSYIGLIIPSLFLLGHFRLYKRANKRGGAWLFIYSASLYPLIMQFFQDQYFSLFSTWIQVCFWYILCLHPYNKSGIKNDRHRHRQLEFWSPASRMH